MTPFGQRLTYTTQGSPNHVPQHPSATQAKAASGDDHRSGPGSSPFSGLFPFFRPAGFCLFPSSPRPAAAGAYFWPRRRLNARTFGNASKVTGKLGHRTERPSLPASAKNLILPSRSQIHTSSAPFSKYRRFFCCISAGVLLGERTSTQITDASLNTFRSPSLTVLDRRPHYVRHFVSFRSRDSHIKTGMPFR